MIKEIIGGIIIFGFGVCIGLGVQNNELESKYKKLELLKQMIKNRNNTMVDNFAKLYSMTEHDEDSFTDIDAILASMWMD